MLNITALPAFNDNYIWVLDNDTNECIVVDPGDANAVAHYLEQNQKELSAILVTHHHYDHTDGIEALCKKFSPTIYGPANSPFKGIQHPLTDGDHIDLLDHRFTVTHVPGHTLDHISYYCGSGEGALFCGDTLFLAGCGRLFEGTPEQMLTAMHYFRQLPPTTQVYCTHEYSLANLDFAYTVEPGNLDIQLAISKCKQLRNKGLPTLPSSISQELLINPFMRTHIDSVITAALKHEQAATFTETEVFTSLREWKNTF